MKMRKRIAALIAVAMIASLMPMTAFAASTNRVTNTVTVGENQELIKGLEPTLVIDLKDALKADKAFYLELENAEWLKDGEIIEATTTTTSWSAIEVEVGETDKTVTLKRVDDTTLEVKSSTGLSKEAIIEIPLYVKATGGDASVTVDSYGTVVTGGKYVFAVADDSDAKVKVGDVETIVDKGEIAKITIEEPYAGAFADKDKTEITLTLDNDDFDFVSRGKAIGKRGFGFTKLGTISNKNQKVTFTIDESTITDKQKGIIEIEGVEIRASRKAEEGDITVFIESEFVENETLVVAKYGDYATKLTTEDVEEFTAGRKETVKFKLEQVGSGAITPGRYLDFIFSDDIKVEKVKKPNLVEMDNDEDNEFTIEDFDGEDGDIEFEVEIEIPAKFEGDLMVKAVGRAIEETKELKLAEVKAPVTVEVEAMKVDIAQKSNKGGKITITETEKGMLRRGNIVIQLPEDLIDAKAKFINVGDLEIEADGLRVDDAVLNTTDSAIEIKVTRESKEAGSIEISGFEVQTGRLLADGAYEIEIGGKAISDLDDFDPIATEDFILVGDQLTKAEVKFVIGSDKFLVDGKEMTMDAAAYIKDGRTMVPLRYLSYALGIDEESIKFNAGVVTIFDGARVIQVKNGDNNLVVNGMSIPMITSAEIVEDRTYVPITEIGGLFGVQGTWDAATQTATFK